MPVSDELKRVYTSAPRDDYYIETLSIEHPLITTRYLTNQYPSFTADLEDTTPITFEYVPFQVIPPRASEDAALSLQVAIDNTSRELVDELEILSAQPTEPIILKYRVYTASDLTSPANDPPMTLDITSLNMTNSIITFSAGTTNLRSLPFPKVLYTVEEFPGLSR
jgi:hypothetical protein